MDGSGAEIKASDARFLRDLSSLFFSACSAERAATPSRPRGPNVAPRAERASAACLGNIPESPPPSAPMAALRFSLFASNALCNLKIDHVICAQAILTKRGVI
jgi:hypothetical protein